MIDPLLTGRRINLRVYQPGGSIERHAVGVIGERAAKAKPAKFHDGYMVRLTPPIDLQGSRIIEAYVVPSGSYPYVEGRDKMSDLIHESVRVTFTWKSDDGSTWMSPGEKGTFAEITLLR